MKEPGGGERFTKFCVNCGLGTTDTAAAAAPLLPAGGFHWFIPFCTLMPITLFRLIYRITPKQNYVMESNNLHEKYSVDYLSLLKAITARAKRKYLTLTSCIADRPRSPFHGNYIGQTQKNNLSEMSEEDTNYLN